MSAHCRVADRVLEPASPTELIPNVAATTEVGVVGVVQVRSDGGDRPHFVSRPGAPAAIARRRCARPI